MTNRTYHPRNQTVHGFPAQEHPAYYTWAGMLSRCTNPSSPHWENYGGRGIKVDPRWHHFRDFAEDMGLPPEAGLTIDRKDNNAGYCKANCHWTTKSEQAANRRTFKNNTTGYTGVVETTVSMSAFEARYDYEKVRYKLGCFSTAQEAAEVREAFVGLFHTDKGAALAMVPPETTWRSSSTGVRGVTKHSDGYIARTTVSGERVYLGLFATVDEAAQAITRFKQEQLLFS